MGQYAEPLLVKFLTSNFLHFLPLLTERSPNLGYL
jgi:hypothetical protein